MDRPKEGVWTTVDAVADVLSGKYGDRKHVIVDCRYPFEYEGGHIKGALNLYTKKLFDDYFLDEQGSFRVTSDTIIILHCEFSQKRGPKMFGHLRE